MVARARELTRTAVRLTARNVTAAAAGKTALVVAPHPDDETLGCGATILRKTAAGTQVTLLMVTDGRNSHRGAAMLPEELAVLRRRELGEAARRLGVAPTAVRWAGLVDGRVVMQEDRLVEVIAEMIAEFRPAEVYATCAAEPHPDHAAVGRAARRAVRQVGRVDLLEYPVWLWGAWPLRRPDRLGSALTAAGLVLRRGAVSVGTGTYREAKLRALQAYDSQLRRPAGVPDGEPWQTLPDAVLAAAADEVEVFFRVPEGAGVRS